MKAKWIALCVGLGLALVSVALGCLYMNERRVQRATMELVHAKGEVDEDSAEVMATLDVYTDWRYVTPALVSGTAGVGFLGFGGIMALFAALDRRSGTRSTAAANQ